MPALAILGRDAEDDVGIVAIVPAGYFLALRICFLYIGLPFVRFAALVFSPTLGRISAVKRS